MKRLSLLLSLLPRLISTFSLHPTAHIRPTTLRYFSSVEDDLQSSALLPPLGSDGVYHIADEAEHTALLEAHHDKILVMKVFAPWCRACKGLEPKFNAIVKGEAFQNLPIIWADLSIQHNKEFVRKLGVLALPTVQFYVGGSLTETFPCGPSKVKVLTRKLGQLINDNVDAATRQLKQTLPATPAQPANASYVVSEVDASKPEMSTHDMEYLMQQVPYFREMSLADAEQSLNRAQLVEYDGNTVIIREGKPGRTFYVIKEGEVEILQKIGADPMLTPSSYLGTVINRLEPGDWFGERALITGEDRAASIRTITKTKCWTLDKDDFPYSSELSGRTKGVTDDLDSINDKYGIVGGMEDAYYSKQLKDATAASQVRGSPNKPGAISGVDTDDDWEVDDDILSTVDTPELTAKVENDAILSLLTRFQLIRQVHRCLQYIRQTQARWGDEGIRKRRNFLIERLSKRQRDEFMEAFDMIDKGNDGYVTLEELKAFMELVGDPRSENEVREIMDQARDVDASSQPVLTPTDFMGIMAEAEFYHLFRDVFASLDKEDSGFVRASEINRVLAGVRDLISDDRNSIIDQMDDDLLIDYQTFSRMMLGTSLI